MNTFCLVSRTYSRIDFKEYVSLSKKNEGIRKYSYYQWVPIVLFLQGILFLIPHLLFSVTENSYIVNWLKKPLKLYTHDDIILVVRYITKRLGDFDGWTFNIFLCEIAFGLNIAGNIILTNKFLGGSFMDYGYKGYNKEQHREVIFPKMTKCSFHRYGPSGTIENKEAICIMPLNVMNERLNILMWFWFVLLLLVSSYILIRRVFYVLILSFRKKCALPLKLTLANNLSRDSVTVLVNILTFTDWLFIEQIESFFDHKVYTKLLQLMSHEISGPHNFVSDNTSLNFHEYVSIYDL